MPKLIYATFDSYSYESLGWMRCTMQFISAHDVLTISSPIIAGKQDSVLCRYPVGGKKPNSRSKTAILKQVEHYGITDLLPITD